MVVGGRARGTPWRHPLFFNAKGWPLLRSGTMSGKVTAWVRSAVTGDNRVGLTPAEVSCIARQQCFSRAREDARHGGSQRRGGPT